MILTRRFPWGGAAARPGARLGGLARVRMPPPLTPMIDVTFQLLLFFLLATTFRQAEGQLAASLPQGQGAGGLDQTIVRPIRVTVLPAADGAAAYHLDDTAAVLPDAEALYRELTARRQAYGSDEVPVAVQPRWDVPWQYVVEADNQAHRAGFKNVAVVSSP